MHIYQDTSHFRAPYKSLLSVAGFGQEAPVAAPSTFEVSQMQINAVAPVGPDGIRRYTPATAALLLKNLQQWNAIQQGLPNTVKVEPYTKEQLDAAKVSPEVAAIVEAGNGAAWTRRKVSEGFAVYAPISLVWPTTEAMAAGVYLGVTPYTDKASMVAASALPIGAYLAEPGSIPDSDTDWLENLAIVAGITVGLGLAAWAFKKYSKRGGPLGGKLAVPNARRLGPRRRVSKKLLASFRKKHPRMRLTPTQLRQLSAGAAKRLKRAGGMKRYAVQVYYEGDGGYGAWGTELATNDLQRARWKAQDQMRGGEEVRVMDRRTRRMVFKSW